MSALTDDETLERCGRLSPALASRADEAEALRRLPPATMADIGDADLWRLVVPTSLGGHGLGIRALAHGTRMLAHGCPASAWTISFLVMHNWLLTKFPAAARAELFTPTRPFALAPAPLAPTGTATEAEGGVRVTGRWEWATGVHHADWVMVHAVQTEPEFTTRFVLVPIAEVTVEDVWHTSGMRATGSTAVRLDDVFVPSHRTAAAADVMFGGDPIEGDGMAGLPVPQVLALVAAAPALGAAEAATQLFRERIGERVLAYSLGDKARDQPVSQARLGSVLADLAATQANWGRAIERLAAVHDDAAPLSLDERADLRLAATHTVRSARDIITSIGDGSGASVYFTGSPFQRLQRDIEVLKGHVVFDWDRTTELAGAPRSASHLGPPT
jgi:3-hydroxy-9,10-secoandrosta-1,3,5(10)-triene-9,17-dione monooxygenase